MVSRRNTQMEKINTRNTQMEKINKLNLQYCELTFNNPADTIIDQSRSSS